VLDSHHFLRDALFNQSDKNQGTCWHRPVIVRNMLTRLGDVIGHLKVVPERPDDDVIDNDLVLVWGSQRRIITGSELPQWKQETPHSNREYHRSRGRFDAGPAHALPSHPLRRQLRMRPGQMESRLFDFFQIIPGVCR
jgi:hypothetical protein